MDILSIENEAEQKKHFAMMKAIERDISVIHGFLVFTDLMKKEYWNGMNRLIQRYGLNEL